MAEIEIRCGDELVGTITLGARCVELSARSCADVTLAEVRSGGVLLQAASGTVRVFRLAQEGRVLEVLPLPLEERFAIDGDFDLFRRRDGGRCKTSQLTEELVLHCARRPMQLLVGKGKEARRVTIGDRPITVGADSLNDIVITDRAVSRVHFRLEPFEQGVCVRDLNSSNATYINGVRVNRADLRIGSKIRIGRTDLRVAPAATQTGGGFHGLVAQSTSMLRVLSEAESFASLSWPVLILGESGTGKEEIARLLHSSGPRADKSFVALNAGGLPAQLIESELFGHERGAFTGAHAMHRGVFERADGGSLFLDEIGELPAELQSRLLRVLETWTISRVGAEADRPVDVRLICATHRDLRSLVAEGRFRRDLYYRINRLVIDVPPLRQRNDDIVCLAEHFLAKMIDEVGDKSLCDDAKAALLSYPWPGNARELRNVLSAAAARSGGHELSVHEIGQAMLQVAAPEQSVAQDVSFAEVVAQYRGNLSAASRALGIPRSTLRDRLKRSDAASA